MTEMHLSTYSTWHHKNGFAREHERSKHHLLTVKGTVAPDITVISFVLTEDSVFVDYKSS